MNNYHASTFVVTFERNVRSSDEDSDKVSLVVYGATKESVLNQCSALGLVVCKIVEYFDCFEKSTA
tara:strand:+ start:270 stop:467 length:198 start_codon:yes stop_codon:yes gene_type:complete